jgi:ABC-type transport system involved in cytochrome bd biosynthesis fused ATPase/permease subunit
MKDAYFKKEDITEYFHFLINKYSLKDLYYKFIIFYFLFIFTRESFFWTIILTTQNNVQDKKKMFKIIVTLFSILAIAIIFENISSKLKVKLECALNECHLEYSISYLNNLKGNDVLKMNLVEQFNNIEIIKGGLSNKIQELSLIMIIIATFITVLISSRRINVILVGSLIIFFNSLIYFSQKKNISLENDLNEENTENINKIRNYILESKQKIINKNFNFLYCQNLFKKYICNSMSLVKIENNINTYNGLLVLITTLLIVAFKYKTSSILDIFVYLLIVYDLDYFVDSLFNYYKVSKALTKANISLSNFFSGNNDERKEYNKFEKIDSMDIIKLENNIPSLSISQPLHFVRGDRVLCNGQSGEGKTTFFKFLKNIETPDKATYIINKEKEFTSFKEISCKIFITIQNNKPLYNEKLYNFITNFEEKPNINQIKELLKCVSLEHIFTGEKDQEIVIENLSGGEQMRLGLCQSLYHILSQDYQIILFDEIDVNLDLTTASKIFENIFHKLKDKILFFIVHNEELKPYFKKQIIFYNHILHPNFSF